jgi:tetratricopeptide (TPR) repeat protein
MLLLLLLPHGLRAGAATQATARVSQATTGETWTSVRSKNFRLVGNASEAEIKEVGVRLEQFREVFTRLLPGEHFESRVPVTVVVFNSEESYRPFKPLYLEQPGDVSGYFKSGQHADYITLSVDEARARGTASIVFHEYVHLLLRNGAGVAPLWFNEGLAEYYSTFEISPDARRVTLGQRLEARAQVLRTGAWIPLSALLAADRWSPAYAGAEQRRLFYAESWALVHYLFNGQGGRRRAQLTSYLDLLASGSTVEAAFRTAFQTDFAGLEAELRAYVLFNQYPTQAVSFDRAVLFDTALEAAPLPYPEALAVLGDLLLRTERPAEAEDYLLRAVELAPAHGAAHTSLAVLRLGENRIAEARTHLECAISADARDHLARYLYAESLLRSASDADLTVEGFERKTRLLRAELKRAIGLAPHFLPAYRLLAEVEIERGARMEEALATIGRAIELAPRRHEFKLLLAQAHLRRDDLAAARRTLEALAQAATDTETRAKAQALLKTAAEREALLARRGTDETTAPPDSLPTKPVQPCDMPEPGPQIKQLRFEGEQVCGMLAQVDCEGAGVVLTVVAGGRTLKLQNSALRRIRFVTYTTEVSGQLTCGLREPANPVLVTFRPPKDAATNADGEVIAVEFIPRDWLVAASRP